MQWFQMLNDDDNVNMFYSKLDGNFGLVQISRENRTRLEYVMQLLRKLECITPHDRDKLLATWKQYDKSNVRRWGFNEIP